MVKPEKFGHLRLVYHFTVPLRNSISRPYEIKMWVQFGSKMAKKAIFIPARSCSSCSFSLVSLEVFSPAQIFWWGSYDIPVIFFLSFSFRGGSQWYGHNSRAWMLIIRKISKIVVSLSLFLQVVSLLLDVTLRSVFFWSFFLGLCASRQITYHFYFLVK